MTETGDQSVAVPAASWPPTPTPEAALQGDMERKDDVTSMQHAPLVEAPPVLLLQVLVLGVSPPRPLSKDTLRGDMVLPAAATVAE